MLYSIFGALVSISSSRNSVCGIFSKKNYSAHVLHNKAPSATMWFSDVFVIDFGQQRMSVAQINVLSVYGGTSNTFNQVQFLVDLLFSPGL